MTTFPIIPIAQASHYALTGHARLSASSSGQWSDCTAAPGEQDGKPNNGNDASRWGTACHLLSETSLIDDCEPIEFLGWSVEFHEKDGKRGEELLVESTDGKCAHVVPIDAEQVATSATFVKFVRDLVLATGGTLYVEQKLPLTQITGEHDAYGSGDAVIVVPHQRLIIVVDLKGGMLKVLAKEEIHDTIDIFGVGAPKVIPNKQLSCYGDGALEKFGRQNFDTVEMHIVQPRIHHFDSVRVSTIELAETIDFLRAKADETRTNPQYSPSYKNCLFCRAKFTCKARTANVLTTVCDATGFGDASEVPAPRQVPDYELGALYDCLDQIEEWCKDIRSRTYAAVLAGETVSTRKGPMKMVAGRNGARQWTEPDTAKDILTRAFGVPTGLVHTQPKFLSVAQIEELVTTRRLTKAEFALLEAHLVKPTSGKPVLAEADDPRPSITSASADGFDDVSQPEATPHQ